MNDLSSEDVEFYKEKFGEEAPLLEDNLDFFIYRCWINSRESTGMAMSVNTNVVFKYAKKEKIDALFLMETVKQIEDKLNGYKSKAN